MKFRKEHNIAGIEGSSYAPRPREISVEFDDFTAGCTKEAVEELTRYHTDTPDTLNDRRVDCMEALAQLSVQRLVLTHDGNGLVGVKALHG